MSRGLGALQRALLEGLEQVEHASVLDLLERIDGVPINEISDARYTSARRAVRRLVEQGCVVELGRRMHNWTTSDGRPWRSALKHYAMPQFGVAYYERFVTVFRDKRSKLAAARALQHLDPKSLPEALRHDRR